VSEQPPTAEQRARNVERMRRLEVELGEAQATLGVAVYEAVRVYRALHDGREALREVFGMEPLGDMAPLYGELARAADQREEASSGD
jgi:hypothetical protein